MDDRGAQLVYGIHAVRHALEAAPEAALELYVQVGARGPGLAEVLEVAARAGVRVQPAHGPTLDGLAEGGRHQGVVLRVRAAAPLAEGDLDGLVAGAGGQALFLVLDGVQDPHNLGACLRVADAAGATALVVPAHRGVGITPAVRKVASGAAESVPFVAVANLARALARLGGLGVWSVGTADDAPGTLWDLDLRLPTAIVLGAEDSGLRRLTRERCDHLAALPMHGRVTSLNVSVAAGVCLYEVLRQRRAPAGP